jgi:hypothetical protein
MTDRLDAALAGDGQIWRDELGAAPSLHALLDAHASASRRRPTMWLAAVCSVVAVIAIAVTLSVVSRPSGTAGDQSGGSAVASFVGFRWRATDVAHARRHNRIPQRLGAYFGFSTDGTYTATYGYNGRYRVTGTGFRTYHVSVPYNLRISSDPTVAAMVAAAQAVSTSSSGVTALAEGQRLTLAVGTYRITCLRVGAQPNAPAELPSSTRTPR